MVEQKKFNLERYVNYKIYKSGRVFFTNEWSVYRCIRLACFNLRSLQMTGRSCRNDRNIHNAANSLHALLFQNDLVSYPLVKNDVDSK